MADRSERLRRLEDKEAIRNLIASYGPLADSGASQELAQLWTDDGEYDVGGYGTARGRDDIAALIESETHQELMRMGCAHILSPHAIRVDEEEATAAGYSVVWRRKDGAMEPWRVSWNVWQFVRRGSEWFVRRRINRPVGGPVDGESDFFLAAMR